MNSSFEPKSYTTLLFSSQFQLAQPNIQPDVHYESIGSNNSFTGKSNVERWSPVSGSIAKAIVAAAIITVAFVLTRCFV